MINKKQSQRYPEIFVFLSYWKNFTETKKWVRISHGAPAISIRVIEIYTVYISKKKKKKKNSAF